MRTRKYRLVTRVERLSNRTIRWALRRGVAPATWAAAILDRLMASQPLTIRIDLETLT